MKNKNKETVKLAEEFLKVKALAEKLQDPRVTGVNLKKWGLNPNSPLVDKFIELHKDKYDLVGDFINKTTPEETDRRRLKYIKRKLIAIDKEIESKKNERFEIQKRAHELEEKIGNNENS